MTTRVHLRDKLNATFKTAFDDETIEIFESMTADDVFDWDSVSHITLVLLIEDQFGINLNASEVGELENVGAMISLLEQKLSG